MHICLYFKEKMGDVYIQKHFVSLTFRTKESHEKSFVNKLTFEITLITLSMDILCTAQIV